MLDRQGDLTQEQMLSELIYEGEIHRLLKKNILYKQRRDFLYQCLEENFKDAVRFKTNGWINMVTV
jgi:GntR family transcriptional regulator/MocR family aminotransferase